jgi:hypothetical protein
MGDGRDLRNQGRVIMAMGYPYVALNSKNPSRYDILQVVRATVTSPANSRACFALSWVDPLHEIAEK